MNLPSKEDARLCASVVREVTRTRGLTDPSSIGRLTVTVARLFNKGLRERESLLSEAMALADMPVAQKEHHPLLAELPNITPGTIDLSVEPKNERRNHQQ